MLSRDSLTYTVSQKQSNQVVPSLEFILCEEEKRKSLKKKDGSTEQMKKKKSMSLQTTCNSSKKTGSKWLQVGKIDTKRSNKENPKKTKVPIKVPLKTERAKPRLSHPKTIETLEKYKQRINIYLKGIML